VRNSLSNKNIIISTDLDGTLLDNFNYSFVSIYPFYDAINENSILIFNTSKTFKEICEVDKSLVANSPSIVENGSAIFIPLKLKLEISSTFKLLDKYKVIILGIELDEIEKLLMEPSVSHYLKNCNFLNNMTIDEICKVTGLLPNIASKSRKRDFSKSFLWNGSISDFKKFELTLKNLNLRILKGGRFYHIIGSSNKGKALRLILEIYKKNFPYESFITIALGNSENDNSMLKVTDFAGVVRSSADFILNLKRKKNVFYSNSLAPLGWKNVLLKMDPIKKLNLG